MSARVDNAPSESGRHDYEVQESSASHKCISDPRIEMILDEVEGSVLDVGCVQHNPRKRTDPNWLHKYLYSEAEAVLGIDVDKDGVRILQEAGYHVQVGDAEQLAIDETFDTIVAGELIEHLSCPGAFLDGAHDLLADEGTLVLSTPNPWCFARLKNLATSGEMDCNPGHTCYFDRRTLRLLLERHGYTVDKIEWVPPRCRGITNGLYRLGGRARRLGSTQLLAIATPAP